MSEVDVYQLPELGYFVTATVTNRLKGNVSIGLTITEKIRLS